MCPYYMKIKYDANIDAIYVILSDDKVVESKERSKDVIVNYNNEIVAIEVLNVKDNNHTIKLPLVLKSA